MLVEDPETNSPEYDVGARLQVVIADDNPAMLDAVRRMLKNDYQVVAALKDSSTVVSQVLMLKPDVLVLDIAMPEINGYEITRQLRLQKCRSKIIIFTVHEELDFIRAAFEAGASGYVFKSRMNTDLSAAIKTVESGRVFIPEAPIAQ